MGLISRKLYTSQACYLRLVIAASIYGLILEKLYTPLKKKKALKSLLTEEKILNYLKYVTPIRSSSRKNEWLFHIPKDRYIKRFIELDDNGYVWKDRVYQQLINDHGRDVI